MYLFLFFKKFEHVLHVDEGILDHSAVKHEHSLQQEQKQTTCNSDHSISSHYVLVLPVVGSKPVEGSVELDNVGAKQDVVSNLVE